MTAHPSWEEVLAAVEQDVAGSAALLTRDTPEAGPPPDRHLAPAQAQLPAGDPVLPPLAEMPPVPEALRERIRDLRLRIVELQVELAAELAQARAAQTGALARAAASRPAAGQPAARFVDCRL